MRRTALLLSLLGALLAAALWFLFWISPMNAQIADLRDQLRTAEDEEMTLRTTLARLQRIQEAELTYIAAVGAIEAMIPPSPDLADFVDQLDVLKRETGVRWVSITPGLPSQVEGEDFLAIPVTVNIEGQYFETLGYLYGLAELERLVRVDTVSVSSSEDEDGFTILTVTLTGNIYTTGVLGPLPPEDTSEEQEDEQGGDEQGTDETTTTTTEGG